MPNDGYFVDQSQGLRLMDLVMILWRKKWLIAIPSLGCAILAAIITFVLPKEWKITAVVQVGSYISQSPAGVLSDDSVIDPRTLAARINREAYASVVAKKLQVRLDQIPSFSAENPANTDIVQVDIRDRDPLLSKAALEALLAALKEDLDRRLEIEAKKGELLIENGENIVQQKSLDIRVKELEKEQLRMRIANTKTRTDISEARAVRLVEEMKAVKERSDSISNGQLVALAEKKDPSEAMSFLVYSNEIMQNLRYYSTIEESLNTERIQREDLKLAADSNRSSIQEIDAAIEKIRSEIADWKNQIALFRRILAGMKPTVFLKEPIISKHPVAPSKRKNAAAAGVLGLILFSGVAFFLDSLKRYQARTRAA
jgi:capsular polysaccharide biosynthesis protein